MQASKKAVFDTFFHFQIKRQNFPVAFDRPAYKNPLEFSSKFSLFLWLY